MTHKRTSLRNAMVARLSGLTTCGANVFPSRVRPLSAAELPAILVMTGGEEMDTESLAFGIPNRRQLHLGLDVVVKSADGYEDTADTVLEEIENALFDTQDHNTLGGLALCTTLASIGDPEMDASTDKPVIRLPIHLRITYF